MGDDVKKHVKRVGEEWRTISSEIVDREHTEKKVRRGKWRRRKYDTNHSQPHLWRQGQKQENNISFL